MHGCNNLEDKEFKGNKPMCTQLYIINVAKQDIVNVTETVFVHKFYPVN